MDLIKEGWFCERSPLWPGQCLSLQVKRVLHHERSTYQDILILDTEAHGTTLVLDGIIQCTERDEFAYQESVAMLPLCAHPRPESVLVVGGGDGGVVREAVKHPAVRHVHHVEIDERVVELSKRYLPQMARGFSSPKCVEHIEDGFQYLSKHPGQFDVIITDSSDPVGPNEPLFGEQYMALLHGALRPGGIVCCQAGSPWLDVQAVRRRVLAASRHFPLVRYALASVPTYPTGQIGFIVASSCPEREPQVVRSHVPVHQLPDEDKLRYYDAEVHAAAFVLPAWVRAALQPPAGPETSTQT